MQNRKIPKVPKEERIGFDEGYHKLPNWLVVSICIVIFIGIVCWLFIN